MPLRNGFSNLQLQLVKLSSLVLLIAVTHSSYSQQLNFRSFSFPQGLNTYNIQKVIQDKYGFIWIATQDGLYRYNGNTFEAFRKQGGEGPGIRENFVCDIYYPGQDILYAATFNGGIDIIDITSLSIKNIVDKISDSSDGVPNLWFTKLFCDSHQNLWIGGKDFLSIYNSSSQSFIHLKHFAGFNGTINVSFIKPVDSNTVAIGIAGLGVLLYNTNTLNQVGHIQQFTPSSDSLLEEMTDMLIVKDEIYFSSNGAIARGLIAHNNWKFKELIVLPKLAGSVINCIAFDGKKEIWLGTNLGMGRFDLSTRTFELISSEMNQNRWLVDNSIRHLMIDSQNNLWISTSKILQLVNLNLNPFTHFSGNRPGSNQMNHIYSLVQKNQNEIFATGTDGLYVVNLTTEKVDLVKNSETLGTVHYIMNVESDWWLVSTDEGMYLYSEKIGLLSQDELINKFPEWKPFIRNYFNSSVKVDTKIYWASEEQGGLLIWDIASRTIGKYKANIASSKGLPENHIHNIKQDKEGYLWLLFDNSVAKYSVAEDRVIQTIQYTPKGKTFNSGIFFDAFDDGTTVWFGTFGGGINGYNKRDKTWKYITEQDGLCNNSVYGILPETDSIIWVSTNMGISRVNYISTKCTNYYFEDGLQDNSFDEKGSLQIGDRMFFGGINGFTMLNISKYKPNLIKFPVYIHRVELFAKGRKQVLNDLNWERLRLPPTTSSLVIYLSALSFSNSRKLNFSYRIKGFQDDYIPVGSDNTIALNAMNSGNYDVEIRYLNEAGEFVTNDLKLSFYIVPFWYQTWWFKILLLMAALGVLYTIYLVRVTEIRNEQKNKEINRKRFTR